MLFPDDGVELARIGVNAEVVQLERGGNRQDHVGEQRVVFHPRMLDQEELQVGVGKRVLELVATVPAGGPAGRVGPDHLDAVVAVLRELEVLELVGAVVAARGVAVPFHLLSFLNGDALRHQRLRNERRGKLAQNRAVVARANLGKEVSRGQRVERVHADKGPFDEFHLVAARFAHCLHSEQVHLQARGLMRIARADVAAAVAVADGHVVLGPVARERLDAVSRHVALLLGPFRRLGNAVLVAEHVVLEPVEAVGVRLHVLGVVGALRHPHVRDGELHGRVGVGQNRDPHVGVHGVGVVHVRRDVDLLHTDFGEPEAQTRRLLARPAPRRGLRVAAPEQKRVGILGDVLEQVVLMGVLAQRLVAPGVLGAPVPAFPAVWLAGLHGEAARHVQKVRHGAMRAVDRTGLAVAVALAEDGVAAVGFVDALDLRRDDVGGLVPADTLELGLAAVLRVALAVGIPVHALEREGDAVGRIGAGLVDEGERGVQRLHARLEGVALRVDRPVVQILFGVMLVVVHRTHTNNFAVFRVNGGQVGAVAERTQRQVLVDGFIRCLHAPPTFVVSCRSRMPCADARGCGE